MKNQISLLKIGDTQKKTYTTALFQMQIKDNNCDKIHYHYADISESFKINW